MKLPNLLIVIFVFSGLLFAQDSMNGTPAFGNYSVDKFDIVNLQNLNVMFSIPIASVSGRGLNTNVGLNFNQSVWRLSQDPTLSSPSGFSWQLAEGFGPGTTFAPGWNFGQIIPYVRYTQQTFQCDLIHNGTASYIRSKGYTVVEPDGTTHAFPLEIISNSPGHQNSNCLDNTTGTLTSNASDKSGFQLTVATSGGGLPAAPVAYSPSGLKINSSAKNNPPILQTGSIEDVNGNTLTAIQINANEVDWQDSRGRIAVKIITTLSNGLPIQYQYLTPNTSGGYNTTTVFLQSFSLRTNFACSQGHTEGAANGVLPTAITLANGKSFTFSYEPTPGNPAATTGRIQAVNIPMGGRYQYSYPGANDGVSCVPELAGNFFSHFDQTNTLTRTISGAISTLTANYTWARLDAHDIQTTMTTSAIPVDPQAVIKKVLTWSNGQLPVPPFTVINGTAEQQYDSSQSRVLRTVVTNKDATSGFPISKVTILEDGQTQSETDYSFGTGNILLSQSDYDYGFGTHGSLIRSSAYIYKTDSTYTAKNILDRVKDLTISDSTGVLAETHYDYDEFQFKSCPTLVSGHDDNILCTDLIRGNATTETRYLDPVTPAQPIIRHKYFDWFGNVVQSDEDCCTQITNAFSANTNYAYPDSVTKGPTGGPQIASTAVYDPLTGFVTTARDANNQPTIYQYNDPLNRTTSISYPDGGSTTFSYDDTKRLVTKTEAIGTGVAPRTTVSIYDQLGQLTQTKLTSDPQGTIFTDYTFDALGRRKTASNPYRTTSDPTYGVSTSSYDGLGRVTQMIPPDGTATHGNVSTFYSLNTAIVTDEAGKQRESITDALGRIIEADEPGTQPPPVNNHATLQTDGNFVLYDSSANALWSTGTSGTNASAIQMQDDANLVLYIFKWQAGVYVAPTGGTIPYDGCRVGATLFATQILASGACLESPSGRYMLLMQSDGNLFIYDRSVGQVTWAANTYGHPGAYANLQSDGNFVVYDINGIGIWSSGTYGTFSERLDMQDDGRIIIYKSAWSSGTSNGNFNQTTIAHPSCDVGTGTGWTGVLGSGQCFVSPNGHFELLLQMDGSLVVNDLGVTPAFALWSSGMGTGLTPLSPGYSFVTKYFYDGLGNLTCVEQHGGDSSGTGCSAPASSDANSTWRVRRFTYDPLSRLTSSSNPEANSVTSGTPLTRVNTTYTYDANGNLLQKISPAPNQSGTATQTISYCYDALNRITGKAYSAQTCSNGQLPPGTAAAAYSYDQATAFGLTISNGVGRRTGMTDQGGTEAWSYDAMGRPASDQRTTAGVTKTTSYLYNLLGSPTSITYPSGRTITYTYNSAGQPITAADSPNSINYVTSATYAPTGALSRLSNGTNLTSVFYYNNRLQPCRFFVTTGAATPTNCTDSGTIGNIMDFTYGFNLSAGDNGNVVSIANNRDTARSQTFSYDLLNRVSTAHTSSTTGTKCFGESFGYDAWGNLLSIGGVNGYTGCTQENPAFGGVNVANRLNTSNYDSSGNMLTSGYTYDAENHLITAGGVTYTYDGDGKRIQKSSGKLYWYGMGSDALDETDSGGATNNASFNEYVFYGGKRTARRDSTNGVFYYFTDHLETSRVIVQAAQTVSCYDADFYPFGGERSPLVNVCPQSYKFIGKERDDSGLDNLEARSYSASMGHFVSSDPEQQSGLDNLEDPQSWNGYAYGRNNPINYADPDGREYEYCAGTDQNGKGINCRRGVSDAQQAEDAKINTFKDGKIYSGNTVVGTYRHLDVDIPGDAQQNVNAAAMIGVGGERFIAAFAKNAIISGVGGGAFSAVTKGVVEGLGIAEETGFVGYQAAALARAARLGLTADTAFNVGNGVLQGETTGITLHALEQAAARSVNSGEVAEALSQVPKGPYGSVLRFFGSTAEVRVNMVTGKIVTVIARAAR